MEAGCEVSINLPLRLFWAWWSSFLFLSSRILMLGHSWSPEARRLARPETAMRIWLRASLMAGSSNSTGFLFLPAPWNLFTVFLIFSN